MRDVDFYFFSMITTMTAVAVPVSAFPETPGGVTSNTGKPPAVDAKANLEDAEVQAASPADDTGPDEGIFSELKRESTGDSYMLEKKKKADEYFRRGVLLFEGKDYSNAAEAFQIAYETLPHPAVLGNIAMCYDRAGKIPDAVSYYRQYLKDPVTSGRNNAMMARLADLSQLVSDLRISCNNQCQIRVDGINRGKSESTVVVMPGQHRVEGLIDDKVMKSELVATQAREVKDVELSVPLPSAPVPPVIIVSQTQKNENPTDFERDRKMVLGGGFWFGSGMTVVSLSLVTAFGTMTLSQKDDYRQSGWTDGDAKDRGERYRTVTNAMIGLSCASALAAVLFAISDVNRLHKKKAAADTSASFTGAGFVISF